MDIQLKGSTERYLHKFGKYKQGNTVLERYWEGYTGQGQYLEGYIVVGQYWEAYT